MRKLTKVVSALLASVLVASSVMALAGCKSKKVEGLDYIPDNQPWFDSKKFELTNPYSEEDFNFVNFSNPVYANDSIYVVFQGYRIIDDEEYKSSSFDYNSTIIKSVFQYDLDGNLVKEISLNADKVEIGDCSNLAADGNKLLITCTAYDDEERAYVNMTLSLDLDTEAIEKQKLNIEVSPYENIIGEYQVSDRKVYLTTDYTTNDFMFHITGDKEKSVSINGSVENLYYVDSCLVINDDTLLAFCYTADGSVAAKLDLNDGKITKTETNFDLYRYSFVPVQDGKAYSSNSEGICTINDKLEIEPVMDYNDTFINLYDTTMSTPLYVDDDMVIITSNDYTSMSIERSIYVFKRAKVNPHAGKKVLDVYSIIPYVPYAEAEAIIKFNQTNSKYYARIKFADVMSSDDPLENNKAYAQASEQLLIDIMSGDGPDVLLGAFDFAEFNNPDYFVDLNTYISKDSSFGNGKYFDNIIEAAKSDDGALYQIPATFLIDCIAAKVSDVGEGHIGFTYESYEEFLKGACNGVSPIQASKNEYLDLCISAGYFKFLKDGKVDFNGDDFKSAADFSNRTFPDVLPESTEMLIINGGISAITTPERLNIFDPSILASETFASTEPIGFYGFPSNEEHGATAIVSSSAAISAEADEETRNAAWEFIKVMLDEEVQSTITDSFPINRSAFEACLTGMADDVDAKYDLYVKSGASQSQMSEMNIRLTNRDVIGYFTDAVLNITNVQRSDTSLGIIVSEEIPAYFAGQKDIDSVIKIINDRAQTIYDERTKK